MPIQARRSTTRSQRRARPLPRPSNGRRHGTTFSARRLPQGQQAGWRTLHGVPEPGLSWPSRSATTRTAEEIAREWLAPWRRPTRKGPAHYRLATCLAEARHPRQKGRAASMRAATNSRQRSHLDPRLTGAHYCLRRFAGASSSGRAARARVRSLSRPGPQKSRRSMSAPSASSIASNWRARTWPRHFRITTLDGQHYLHGRSRRQGGADRFLGHLVRPMPRGAAAYPADRREVRRAAVCGAERQPGHGRGQVEGLRRQERHDLDAVPRRRIRRHESPS